MQRRPSNARQENAPKGHCNQEALISEFAKGENSIMAKSMKPGGGGRFAKMVASGKSPALAAYIGRKKYGSKKMAKFSAAGRKRAG